MNCGIFHYLSGIFFLLSFSFTVVIFFFLKSSFTVVNCEIQ